MFNVPIPGQSLTAEPKNAPYERPPQFVRPEDSLIFMMNKLMEPQRGVGLLAMIEDGMTVEQLTKGLLRVAVANGRFTIDVATLIAPVIHEYIYQLCKENDTPCKHGWEDKEAGAIGEASVRVYNQKTKRKMKERTLEELRKNMRGIPKELPEEVIVEDTVEEPSGLMARRGEV